MKFWKLAIILVVIIGISVGAYIGLAMDECVRAIGMYFRWKSGKWRKMSLVTKQAG